MNRQTSEEAAALTRLGWAVLAALTLAAFILRVWGAEQIAPYVPDTQVIREAMDLGQQLATGSTPFDVGVTGNAKYPLVLPYLLLAMYGAIFGGGRVLGVFHSLQEFTGWLFLNRLTIHVLTVWMFSALNALSVPLAFFIARRFERRLAPWLAAAFSAFSLLLVQFSHHARPHAPLAFFVLLSLYASLRVYERGQWRDYLLAGLAVALASGTLQNGLLALIPFGAAHLLRLDWHSPRRALLTAINPRLVTSLVVFGVGLLAAYPQTLFDPQSVLTVDTNNRGHTMLVFGGTHGISLYAVGFEDLVENFNYVFGYEPGLTVLGLLGLAYYVFRPDHRAEHLILASFVAGFGLPFALFDFSVPHYFAPLAAPLAILTARLLADLYSSASRKTLSALSIGLAGILIAAQLALALRLDYLLARPDTRTQARDWVIATLLPGTALASDFTLELFPDRASIQQQQTDYPGSLGTREQWLSQLPDDQYPSPAFAIIDLDVYRIETGSDLDALLANRPIDYLAFEQYVAQPRTDVVYEYALAHGTRVAVFCPARELDPQIYYALPSDLDLAWKELWQVQFPGPIVQIFSMTPPVAEQPRLPLC